jgi:hypothetical protein
MKPSAETNSHQKVIRASLKIQILSQHFFARAAFCLNLKTSVEWGLKCVDFYFRQGAMRRITCYYNELQRGRN